MSEIINLNKARKRKEREAAEIASAQNRVLFGRTKAEKLSEKIEREEASRRHRGLRREPAPPSNK